MAIVHDTCIMLEIELLRIIREGELVQLPAKPPYKSSRVVINLRYLAQMPVRHDEVAIGIYFYRIGMGNINHTIVEIMIGFCNGHVVATSPFENQVFILIKFLDHIPY